MRALTLALFAVSGCAFGDGGHFGELTARLEAALEIPEDRDLGGGWQKLASEYEVRVERFQLEGIEVALIDTGGASAEFDPADPPPGYSLCHNGHCHADDGRLVDYEEVAAELADGSGAAPIAVLPLALIDLLEGEDRALDCVPACGLPQAEVGLVRVELVGAHWEGTVRDRRDPPRIEGEQPWHFELEIPPEEALALSARVLLPLDRGHDPKIAMTVQLAPTVAVLDRVSFGALSPGPEGFELAADDETREEVTEAIAELELGVNIRR